MPLAATVLADKSVNAIPPALSSVPTIQAVPLYFNTLPDTAPAVSTSDKSLMLAVEMSVDDTVPGTKFDPSHTSASPLLGAVVVVSTSLNALMLVDPISAATLPGTQAAPFHTSACPLLGLATLTFVKSPNACATAAGVVAVHTAPSYDSTWPVVAEPTLVSVNAESEVTNAGTFAKLS